MLSDFISEEKLKLDSKIEDLHSTSQVNLVQDAWMVTVLWGLEQPAPERPGL